MKLLAMLSAVALLAACSSDTPPERMLNGGIAPIWNCVPSPKGKPIWFGNNAVANSEGTANIDSVTLVNSRNLNLVAAHVVPVVRLYGGDLASRNPARSDAWEWEKAVPAAGATVSSASPPLDLVVAVRTTGRGKSDAIRVDYTLDGRRYMATYPTSLEVITKGRCGPPDIAGAPTAPA